MPPINKRWSYELNSVEIRFNIKLLVTSLLYCFVWVKQTFADQRSHVINVMKDLLSIDVLETFPRGGQ